MWLVEFLCVVFLFIRGILIVIKHQKQMLSTILDVAMV